MTVSAKRSLWVGLLWAASTFAMAAAPAPITAIVTVAEGAPFSNALPVAFREPLPTGMSARLSKTEPKLVRDVSYEDVSDWLAAPRRWRQGFIVRFRARLKDPVFFHALDTHMSAHPEWDRILHPPPPIDTLPAPGEPAKNRPAEPQKNPAETPR